MKLLIMPCKTFYVCANITCHPVYIVCNPVHIELSLAHFPFNRLLSCFNSFFYFHGCIDLIIRRYIHPHPDTEIAVRTRIYGGRPSARSVRHDVSVSSSHPVLSFVINILWRISSLFSSTIPKLWYIRRMSLPGVEIIQHLWFLQWSHLSLRFSSSLNTVPSSFS